MDKKTRERIILKMVYDLDSFEKVIDNESPDFRLKYPTENEFFGIEITEFYFSESNARLKNIPSYVTELIRDNKYRHKDDKENIKIDEIKILRDEEVVDTTDSIIQELPSPKEYFEMILETILNKSTKTADYSSGLKHVNLIVLDRENRLNTLSPKNFSKYLFQSKVLPDIVSTNFKEVFLITKVKNQKRLFYPLKLLKFMSEIYLFVDFAKENSELELKDYTELLETFAYCLDQKGLKIFVKNNEQEVEVIHGNYGITIIDDELKIRDYSDYGIKADLRRPNRDKLKNPVKRKTISEYSDFLDQHFFSTTIALKVIQDYEYL